MCITSILSTGQAFLSGTLASGPDLARSVIINKSRTMLTHFRRPHRLFCIFWNVLTAGCIPTTFWFSEEAGRGGGILSFSFHFNFLIFFFLFFFFGGGGGGGLQNSSLIQFVS